MESMRNTTANRNETLFVSATSSATSEKVVVSYDTAKSVIDLYAPGESLQEQGALQALAILFADTKLGDYAGRIWYRSKVGGRYDD